MTAKEQADDVTTSFDSQPGIGISVIVITYHSFSHKVDFEEESYNVTESKSHSELSESERGVEREGLQKPPGMPQNFECESEMESGIDID